MTGWISVFFFCALALPGCTTGNGSGLYPLEAELLPEASGFSLSGRRELKGVFRVTNRGPRVVRLDFPDGQHFEAKLLGREDAPLFLWSEDRLFETSPSQVVVNAGERLEYEVALPTRDMVRGGIYRAVAQLPGYPETERTVELRPR